MITVGWLLLDMNEELFLTHASKIPLKNLNLELGDFFSSSRNVR